MIFRGRPIRTFLAISLVLLLGVLPLTGCGQGSTSSKQEKGNKQNSSGYPAKDITFIVPVSAGGSFDAYSRLLVPYMQKYLPNKVNIIVKNVPGGDWNIGINEINRANPDGYTIGIFNLPGNVVNQLTGAEYDLTKMTWIGRLNEAVYVGALSPKSKLKSLEDMKKAGEVKVGVVSLKSTAGLGALITLKEMGINGKFVTHKGSSEATLSGVRGDVDYVQFPYQDVKKFAVDSKDLIPVVVFNAERLKAFPNVPTIRELGYENLLGIVKLSYVVGGPPGMPEDVAKMLRDAFNQAVKDPEFIQKMEKAGDAAVVTGSHEEAAELVSKSLNNFAKYKDLVLEQQK